MENQEIAKIFYEIADYLEMDEVAFKPYAYQKAAITLETLEEDIGEIYQKGGKKALEEIQTTGAITAYHIDQEDKVHITKTA